MNMPHNAASSTADELQPISDIIPKHRLCGSGMSKAVGLRKAEVKKGIGGTNYRNYLLLYSPEPNALPTELSGDGRPMQRVPRQC
ncbi:hypothetical protein SeMB42_g07983 [Synchytrium endobioticum]|uniref:Uncharacterized protein n=1 Tax=Synchytrium endobioticum TaxID=286115 RepID=A0A507BR92_9FUNG|nr:hypothetical protein SeMB42_g07983 [Synchytrium endobioticum]